MMKQSKTQEMSTLSTAILALGVGIANAVALTLYSVLVFHSLFLGQSSRLRNLKAFMDKEHNH